MRPPLRGILPAAITPFRDDLSVDPDALVAFYQYMLGLGCDGIVCMGTTGEAVSLSHAERIAILDRVADAGLGHKVIAGTSSCNMPESVELAKRAHEAGMAGILVMPPFFYRPASQEGVFAFYARMIEMIGAQILPLYIYDFPKMSGTDIELATIARLREAFPGIIAGLKNSSGDFAEMKRQSEAFDDFDVFSGTEEYLLEGLRAGLAGSISAGFNVFAAEAAAIMQNLHGPDAESLQQNLSAKRRIIAQYPLIAAAKGLQAHRSGDKAWLNIRPPLMPLDDDALMHLQRQLEEVS